VNDINLRVWMADIPAHMPDITPPRVPELLSLTWKAQRETVKAACFCVYRPFLMGPIYSPLFLLERAMADGIGFRLSEEIIVE
jgi:hypothetical protein